MTEVGEPPFLGAIAGDIVGSVFEGSKQWILQRTPDFEPLFARSAYTQSYPKAGYGKAYKRWAFSDDDQPYFSFGNRGAMRVSPVAYAFETLDEVLHHAKATAQVTHNHPEGIKGAQAIAAATFLGRTGATKSDIYHFISGQFGYDLDGTMDSIGGRIPSRRRPAERCRKRSWRFWSPRVTKKPFGWPFRWGVTVILWPRWQERCPLHFTEACPRVLFSSPSSGWMNIWQRFRGSL